MGIFEGKLKICSYFFENFEDKKIRFVRKLEKNCRKKLEKFQKKIG